MIDTLIESTVPTYFSEDTKEYDVDGFKQEVFSLFNISDLETIKEDKIDVDKITDELKERVHKVYEDKAERFGASFEELERVVMLKIVDEKWMEHIDNMHELKNGIGLRAYGQRDPVVVYREEGFDMFEQMIYDIQYDVVKLLMHVTKRDEGAQRQESVHITDTALAQKDNAIDLVDGKESTTKENKSMSRTVVNETPKVGRNDPCPCGSGKKYKNCHGKNA
jgi:preprotein translocase subunit SecA